MRILTACWFTKLPASIAGIGISRGVPNGRLSALRYPVLNPGSWFKSVQVDEYIRRYSAQLADLDARRVVEDLEQLSSGRDCALLCWERPDDDDAWCHRGLVSAWLYEQLGMEVTEWGMEGFGWAHPKVPAQYRAQKYSSTAQN